MWASPIRLGIAGLFVALALFVLARPVGAVTVASESPGPPAATPPKLVALTFDDGPHLANTPRILAILRKYNVRATFFVVGMYAAKYPGLIRQEVAWGHTLGNHGLTHTVLAGNPAKLQAELAATQALLTRAGAQPATLFRPPYGRWDQGTVTGAAALGYRSMLWTVDPQDWSHSATSTSIVQSVLSVVRPGSVVLLHDGGGDRWKTVAALPAIIEGLRAKGYEPVPLLSGALLGLPENPQTSILKSAGISRGLDQAALPPPALADIDTEPWVPLRSAAAGRPAIQPIDRTLPDRLYGWDPVSYTLHWGQPSTFRNDCRQGDCMYRGRLTIYEGSSIPSPRSVVYWMERSQRAEANPALDYAAERANRLELPLIVYYALDEEAPYARARPLTFVLEGLREAGASLRSQGAHLIVRREPTVSGVLRIAQEAQAAEVVADENYLDVGRYWREQVVRDLPIRITLVDAEALVPIREIGSAPADPDRFRARWRTLLPQYVSGPPTVHSRVPAAGPLPRGIDLEAVPANRIVSTLRIDRRAEPVLYYQGGSAQARERLNEYLARASSESESADSKSAANGLPTDVGLLTPYFRWGQLASRTVVQGVTNSPVSASGMEAYLWQAAGSREYAWNAAYYGGCDDGFLSRQGSKYDWESNYAKLRDARTDDELWNAAQKELLSTGVIHGRLQAYWANKLSHWYPGEGQGLAQELQATYGLDAADPISRFSLSSDADRTDDPDMLPSEAMAPDARAIWNDMDVGAYLRWVKERCREMGLDDQLHWPEGDEEARNSQALSAKG